MCTLSHRVGGLLVIKIYSNKPLGISTSFIFFILSYNESDAYPAVGIKSYMYDSIAYRCTANCKTI